MEHEGTGWNQPCYVISVAAKMVGLPAQSLRYYERTGLLEPSRSQGNIRLYSPWDIKRIRLIKTLINDMGVNLAGVEVTLRLINQLHWMEQLVNELQNQLTQFESTSFGGSSLGDQLDSAPTIRYKGVNYDDAIR